MRPHRRALVVAAVLATLASIPAAAQAAISISVAELNSGQLRLEGSGAVPNHALTVSPGSVTGTSDSNGQFKIETSPYSSATCKATVSDGSTSATATLQGCTPTSSPTPSPSPSPSPSPPPSPTPTTGPAVTLTPTSLTYASQTVGTTSAPKTITVKNSGGANLFINSAATHSLDFTTSDDQCSGLTLPPGGTCVMSFTFSPTQNGTRTTTFQVTDNAPNSPQSATLTGTGVGGTAAPLAFDNQFQTCSGSVCDISAGHNTFINNFFTTSFLAKGGTPPYKFSGAVPAGMTLHSSGLFLGFPSSLGTQNFTLTVTDSTGATATQQYTMTVNPSPSPSPGGACQKGGVLREALSGPTFNGRTPSGQAQSDETQFSGCGGFSVLSVSVSNVNLPDGSQLWVTLDFNPVGFITLRGGSGSMRAYNMGDFGVSKDNIRVMDRLPDAAGTQTQILIGGQFG